MVSSADRRCRRGGRREREERGGEDQLEGATGQGRRGKAACVGILEVFYSSSSGINMKYCTQLQLQMDQITFRQSNCCCCLGCCCCCCGLAYKTSAAAAAAKVNWDFLLLTKRRPQRRAEQSTHTAYGQTEREREEGSAGACHVEGDCVAHLRQNHRQHRRVTAATYLPVAEH